MKITDNMKAKLAVIYTEQKTDKERDLVIRCFAAAYDLHPARIKTILCIMRVYKFKK